MKTFFALTFLSLHVSAATYECKAITPISHQVFSYTDDSLGGSATEVDGDTFVLKVTGVFKATEKTVNVLLTDASKRVIKDVTFSGPFELELSDGQIKVSCQKTADQ